jgi:methanogenic corrinoid protein MtbC1
MIIWCAYCQTFVDEKEPYDEFELSHTICLECKVEKKHSSLSENRKFQIEIIKEYGSKLHKAGQSGDIALAQKLIDDGIAIGVRPIEILMGLITPMLYEIGHHWAKGQITVAQEHRFTAFCERIIDLIDQRKQSHDGSQLTRPNFLVINAEGNYHTCGIRILSYWFNAHSISNFLIYPSVPNQEIIQLIRDLRPLHLAISLSMPDQIPGLVELCDQVKSVDENLRPDICVGGYLVKSNPKSLPVLSNVKYFLNLRDFKAHIHSSKNAS